MSTTLGQFKGCGAEGIGEPEIKPTLLPVYFVLGILFGVVLTRSEVLSWFRIQEMFHFQSFRMYGIIGSAVVTAALSLALLKRLKFKSLSGEAIAVPPKTLGSGIRYLTGGTIFGLGWALTGACPGPIVALIGAGVTVMSVGLISALLGTWLYGWVRPRLPH